jgi:hypothetical protein
MARENQGLQIALIVSVMLTIILGVATFLVYRQYTDTAKSLQTAQENSTRQQRQIDKISLENNQLKRYIGVAETQSIEEVSKQFEDDMKKYGGAKSPEVQFYHPLMEELYRTLQDKNKELAAMSDENRQLKDQYVLREASKDGQLKRFDETINQIKQDLEARTETFRKERDRLTEDQNKIKDQLQNARKEMSTATAQAEAKYKELADQLENTRKIAKKLRKENTELTQQVMDTPDGEIRWVNQRDATVWLDLGRADNLTPLMTFSVYPFDVTDLAKGAKKASIEVTQILGDHLAEARILDDEMANPIMPGDKIYSPIWSPGDQRHFALAGLMDINGDGTNNIQLLRNIIHINGGVIDCELNDKGEKIGDISLKTRYLVLGEKPSEKVKPEAASGYENLNSEADNLGIPKISLKELLQRMGYKQQAHAVKFGIGANPSDFKPKPEEGPPRVSTGSVSERYQPRQPTRTGTGGAY